MLWLNQIEKSFGPQALFEEVTWQINPGQRVGLIGPNGVGKSTLIKIIAGFLEADRGEVTHIKGLTLGYLPQEVAELRGTTIREEASEGLSVLWRVERELEELAARLEAELEEDSELLEQYGQLQSRFEQLGGFEAESNVEQILCGLGFRADELDQQCETLSGGWQMRVVLARLLLQRPNILLLDEPTNHLDLESVGWLRHFLESFPGSLILISHDRWFLDQICTHIAELTQAGVELYTGNFDQYLQQVEQRRALLERQRKNQARKTASLEVFIERFRYKSTKAKQVQSRVKLLEKMQTIDEIKDVNTIHFRLADPPKSGRVVITLEDLHQGYVDDALIYRGLNLSIERGQHLALVGPNGAGKSTLLKILAGVVRYQRGTRALGHLVKPYYFAQHQAESLRLDWTVLQEAQSAQEGASITHIRNTLGAFLFGQDDVKKKVEVLSGGEKNRLALVKMLLTPANLLLLDEPTNHLDMGSRAVLGQALASFEGAIVLISHDRHFIDEVCDQVWEVDRGRVTPFLGDYSQYQVRINRGDRPAPLPLYGEKLSLERLDQRVAHTEVKTSKKTSKKTSSGSFGASPHRRGELDDKYTTHKPSADRKTERRRQSELRQAKTKALKPFKEEQRKSEHLVQSLEEEQAKLESIQFETAHYENPEEVVRVAQALKVVQAQLVTAYERWECAELALEEAQSAFQDLQEK